MKGILLGHLVCALHLVCVLAVAAWPRCASGQVAKDEHPNIVLIYADDLGYGDVSSYGAAPFKTPNIDQLAAEGTRFTRAYAPAATCTPSRFALLTGEYAWRKEGTGIARGDASLIIEPGRTTLASVLQEAGYATGVVGKWHLGLGPEGGPDWNGVINPGPYELGFDYSYLIPATGDRVPTVFVENRRVVGLDPDDPIQVSFDEPVGNEPTGKEHPERLTMKPSHGHDQTIVNGISRIGYMSGGKAARWTDETIADTLTAKAVDYIERNQDAPFFLYFATHDIHVPRVPHPRFVGQSGLGPRGDAILELDWSVGQLAQALDRLGLADNTLVVFTSDNGPVLDDGYQDQAVEKLSGHAPSGSLRGGKYSAFEAGTRVPFIARWPGEVAPGSTSEALISQVDLVASLAALTGETLTDQEAPDSRNVLAALRGQSSEGRRAPLVQQATGTLALIEWPWKYIAPSQGPAINQSTNIELGNSSEPQLYNLENDIGEQYNVAGEHPEVVEELSTQLQAIKEEEPSK